MKKEDLFWTYPGESENGQVLIITGRDNVEKYKASGKYPYRMIVSWDYASLPDGMPCDKDASILEQATDLLLAETKKDPAAILTEIYTGAGRRDWILYTRSLHIFGKILNRALASLPLLPLKIEAEEDSNWEEYENMRRSTYISPGD